MVWARWWHSPNLGASPHVSELLSYWPLRSSTEGAPRSIKWTHSQFFRSITPWLIAVRITSVATLDPVVSFRLHMHKALNNWAHVFHDFTLGDGGDEQEAGMVHECTRSRGSLVPVYRWLTSSGMWGPGLCWRGWEVDSARKEYLYGMVVSREGRN